MNNMNQIRTNDGYDDTKGRWPNAVEGSDHSTIRTTLTLAPTATEPSTHQALTPTSFRAKYTDVYKPPIWPIQYWGVLDDCRKSVRLYYHASDDVEAVKKCATQRDVVNIAMSTIIQNGHYVSESQSGYTELWEQSGQLPPNFALYTKTPVSFQLEECLQPLLFMHVINVIGYGFDTTNQPDYQFFSKKGWGTLRPHLTKTLRYVFQCAIDLGLLTVVLSYVGGGAFITLFGDDYLNIFVQSVHDAILLTKYDGAIEVMGSTELVPPLAHKLGRQITNIGRIPAIWKGPDAESKLFVNAWDPHSYAGNGNKGDYSLDGYIGRHSAVSYFSCVDLNPHILKNMYALPT